MLGAIAISRDQASETDIYITNQFGDSRRLAGILKEENRFHDVIHIDAQETRVEVIPATGIKKLWTNAHSLLQYIRNCACIKKTVNRYLHTEYDYERIFIASNSMAGRYALLYYIKTKKHFQLWQYDDGLGSYLDGVAEIVPLYDRFFRTLFFGRKAVSPKKKRVFFSPKLYYGIHGSTEKIYQIPGFDDVEKGLICRAYGADNYQVVLPEGLVLDTLSEAFTTKGWEDYHQLKRRIEEFIGSERIAYKRHPRDTQIQESERKLSSIPFEVLCMKYDMSDRVLLTCNSTAAYTPKIMFDQEPRVVFLCKILEDEMIEKSNDYINVIRNLYRDKSKVIMPETEKELYLILEGLFKDDSGKNEKESKD